MRLRHRSPAELKVETQMTSMIDVVFQLLAFFIVSFKIVEQEGDLALKMPRDGTQEQAASTFVPPVRVRLRADAQGELATIRINDQALADPTALRARVEQLAAPDRPGDLQVDLVCDPALRYEHVMAALTAVSGKRSGDRVLPLASDVRLLTEK